MAEQITISQEEYDRLLNEQQLHENLFSVVEQLQKQIATVEAQNIEMKKKMDTFSLHFGRMYASQSIEETLTAMAELGTYEMRANECQVYSIDAYNQNSMFTVNADGERTYLLPEADSLLKQAVEQHKPYIINDVQNLSESGQFNLGDSSSTEKLNNLLIVPLEDRNGDVIGLAVAKNKQGGFTQEDVDAFNLKDGKIGNTFRMGLENKALQHKATTDPLTHLPNREGMNQFIKQQALPHIQHGEPVSVMVFDIDKFKHFNDDYGHEVGDECLKLVADTFKENLRSSDDSSVFRWGGEEMVVIVPVDEQKATEIADRLRNAIQNTPLPLENGQTSVTVSCGVAQFETNLSYGISKGNILEEFEETFKKADNALYFAKEHGRNQVCPSQIIDDVFKNIDLNDAIVANGNSDNLWISQNKETLVAFSDISRLADITDTKHDKVLETLIARAEKADRTDNIFKDIDNIAVNFVIDINKGVSAELEELKGNTGEKSKRVSVPLTEDEQLAAVNAVISCSKEHGIDIPEFVQKIAEDLTHDNISAPSAEQDMSNLSEFASPVDALENMMAVMDYVIDKNDKGEYMIFDQQTEVYLENYDSPDGKYSGNTFKNAQEIIDRVSGAIEEYIVENIVDGIEETLAGIDPAKYEKAGIAPPATPSASVEEIDNLLKTDPILKEEMVVRGYNADIQYIDLLANHIDGVNLEELFSEKWFGDVTVDDFDNDAAMYDSDTKALNVRVDVSAELVTELLRYTDFDFGEQEQTVRSGYPLDYEKAGIEYADLYVTYNENNKPDIYMLSVQNSDDSKQYFQTDADISKGERPMIVGDDVKNAVNNAVSAHFDGKNIDEIFNDFHIEEAERQ